MAKQLVVDQDTCIGCGTCVAVAPKTFKMNDQGKSVVISPQGDDEATIQNAIDSCPVNAISWKEE
jgi:ferredoxin